MPGKYIKLFFVILLLATACSSGSEEKLKGKWVLAGKVVGKFPTSYWFQGNGKVVAPWEERVSHLRSSGKYEQIGKRHIKLIMTEGPYRGITFFFEIAKLDKDNLTLRGSIQDVHMRRVKENGEK